MTVFYSFWGKQPNNLHTACFMLSGSEFAIDGGEQLLRALDTSEIDQSPGKGRATQAR